MIHAFAACRVAVLSAFRADMAMPYSPGTNQLLSRLAARERARFVAACAHVDLAFEETVADAGNAIAHVYFPTAGFLSLLRPIDGQQIEVALAGREGMFGWAVTLGSSVSDVKCLVQGSGTALRLSPKAFLRQLDLSATLRKTIGRYTYVLMTQFAQTAGCNRFHVVEQRLARWLLMTADRARSNTFRVTQEFLAHMLGVRRAGVTQAAGRLQLRGLIHYRRGELEIRNRPGLEGAACTCYRINLDTYSRVMG
jgi:CRP-like cAMP-binding protein